MTIDNALRALERFQGDTLTESLARIEARITGADTNDVYELCAARDITDELIDSAIAVKRVAGQINVIVHAAGILLSIPRILDPDEKVESVSLGAGNTGRQFDLETNKRIAEYKFIDWQGGAETIRQNATFKDYYELAEYRTDKKKYLYVVGTEYPLKFFNSKRALSSVLSRHPKILSDIKNRYGDDMKTVSDYFNLKGSEVLITDVRPYIGR